MMRTQTWNEKWSALCQTQAGACFIVGSGPSLVKNDWAAFAGRDVIAMNHALWFLPDGLAKIWAFTDWPKEFRRYLPAALHKGLTVIRNGNYKKDPPEPHDRLISVNACDVPGHSVFGTLDLALGIAAHMGYVRAYLISCDGGEGNVAYASTGSYTAFLGDQIWPRLRDGVIEVMSTGARASDANVAHHDVATALEFDNHVRWNARAQRAE